MHSLLRQVPQSAKAQNPCAGTAKAQEPAETSDSVNSYFELFGVSSPIWHREGAS